MAPIVHTIRSRITQHAYAQLALRPGDRRAAVALLLRARGPQLDQIDALFIQRARSPRDPWSGHMALPGGKVEQSDPSPRDAAARETLEEVGVDLSRADFLGPLDDVSAYAQGRPVPLVISPFVYVAENLELSVTPNHEVERVPLDRSGESNKPGQCRRIGLPARRHYLQLALRAH